MGVEAASLNAALRASASGPLDCFEAGVSVGVFGGLDVLCRTRFSKSDALLMMNEWS